MADATTFVHTKIAQLRLMAKVPETAKRPVARAIEREIQRQIAAGVDPDGKPWPRNADGSKPLEGIARHLTVGIVGQTIIVRIKARHVVLHHFGYARGRKRRQVLPTEGVPPALARAIDTAIQRVVGTTGLFGRAA